MEKYIRVSDIKKVCDPYRDWDVPQMTADEVAGIVRCKDCKHWEEEFRECYSPNWDTGKDDLFVTPPGFYCGWGERREDD